MGTSTAPRSLCRRRDNSHDRWESKGCGPPQGALRPPSRFRFVIAAWWVGADRNRVAEEFAIRLERETGCQIIDREHGRVVDTGQLEGMRDQKATVGMRSFLSEFLNALWGFGTRRRGHNE
jgi:hypothetical protein